MFGTAKCLHQMMIFSILEHNTRQLSSCDENRDAIVKYVLKRLAVQATSYKVYLSMLSILISVFEQFKISHLTVRVGVYNDFELECFFCIWNLEIWGF